MLLSMTGHGEGKAQSGEAIAFAEIRSVNNKHLKVHISGDLPAESLAAIEQMVRGKLGRGSVSVRIEFDRSGRGSARLNLDVLKDYQQQLSTLGPEGASIPLQALLGLPGVAESERTTESLSQQRSEAALQAVSHALVKLGEMRTAEGIAMSDSLSANLKLLRQLHEAIVLEAPRVVEQFSNRLTDRINQLLEKHDITVQASDVIREIGIFSERADVNEELVRLASHFEQFCLVMENEGESEGRKLDFLIQEFLRETNTIGSKAGDARIATHVVEMKSVIERMREMVQNVE